MAAKKTMATKDLLDFENVVGFNEKIKAYFEENARQLIAITLIVCLTAGATAYWIISNRASAQAAQNLLNQALYTMNTTPQTEAEQTVGLTRAINLLSQAVDTYSQTDAGQTALFYRAQCKSRQKDYTGATSDYTNFLQHSGLMADQLRPFALENLGHAYEAMGDSTKALKWYEQAVQAGRNAALIGLARTHEAAGSKEPACENYRKYLADQNNTGYLEFVEMKIGKVCR